MILLTKKKRKCITSKNFAIYVKKDLVPMMAKKYFKVKDHCYYAGNTEVLLMISAI